MTGASSADFELFFLPLSYANTRADKTARLPYFSGAQNAAHKSAMSQMTLCAHPSNRRRDTTNSGRSLFFSPSALETDKTVVWLSAPPLIALSGAGFSADKLTGRQQGDLEGPFWLSAHKRRKKTLRRAARSYFVFPPFSYWPRTA